MYIVNLKPECPLLNSLITDLLSLVLIEEENIWCYNMKNVKHYDNEIIDELAITFV